MSERRLIARAKGEDSEAWAKLVHQLYPAVLRFLTLTARSHDDAVDLAQQTFIRVRESLSAFRGESSIKSWVMKIAYHEFLHWNRARGREPLGLVHEPVSELNEDSIVLATAIGELPEVFREAFVLREIDQLSVREVAHVLGVPEGTVKSRCSEARTILARKLASTFRPTQPSAYEADHGE